MQLKIQDLSKSQLEFAIELSAEELKPYLEKAAVNLSAANKVPGFRPGRAPYNLVAKHFGEMRIYEEAAESAIPEVLGQAILEKKLELAGQPKIEIEKMAPGNPLVFKAAVPLMPKVELAEWQKLKFKRSPKEIGAAEIDAVLNEARQARASEAIAARPAAAADKIVIDLEITRDQAPVEGGQAKDHAVYLDEKYYLPGLPEQLIGLKKGEVKEFSLVFPETHYQKHLAGKKADFKVTVKDVFERIWPALDDSFAQGLGQKNMADLRALIENNLKMEAGQKEEQRLEAEILEALVKKTQFGEIPAVLAESEKRKMFEELKQSLSQMGIGFEDYLKDLKKTEAEIVQDFEAGAQNRVRSALVIREIAKREKISYNEEELKEEIRRLREIYKDNEKAEERLNEPGLQDYVAGRLVNRKVMKMLKERLAE